MIGVKPLHIRFDKIDGFIRVYDRTKYLVLFAAEKHDSSYSRIRYLIGVKSGISQVISHNNFPLGKISTFYNVIILIKPVLNKDKNNHDCNIFLKECSYK